MTLVRSWIKRSIFFFFLFWEKERERESLAKILQASNNKMTYKTWRIKHPLFAQECKFLQQQAPLEFMKPGDVEVQNQTTVAFISSFRKGAFEDRVKLEFQCERKGQRMDPSGHIYGHKQFGGHLDLHAPSLLMPMFCKHLHVHLCTVTWKRAVL